MDYIAKIMQLALAHLMRRPGSVLCPIASPQAGEQAGELAKARRGAQFVRLAVGVRGAESMRAARRAFFGHSRLHCIIARFAPFRHGLGICRWLLSFGSKTAWRFPPWRKARLAGFPSFCWPVFFVCP